MTRFSSIRAHFEQRIAQIERKLELPIPSTSDVVARHALLAAFNGNLASELLLSSTVRSGSGPSSNNDFGNPSHTGKEVNDDSDRHQDEASSSRAGPHHPLSASKLPSSSSGKHGSSKGQTGDSDDANTERELDEHDEANGAAMALEVLAGGDFAGPTAHQPLDPAMSALNGSQQEKIPLRQYVYRSILSRSAQCYAGNSSAIYLRLPGMMTARMATEAVLAYIRTKERADLLMNYYSRTVVVVATVRFSVPSNCFLLAVI